MPFSGGRGGGSHPSRQQNMCRSALLPNKHKKVYRKIIDKQAQTSLPSNCVWPSSIIIIAIIIAIPTRASQRYPLHSSSSNWSLGGPYCLITLVHGVVGRIEPARENAMGFHILILTILTFADLCGDVGGVKENVAWGCGGCACCERRWVSPSGTTAGVLHLSSRFPG